MALLLLVIISYGHLLQVAPIAHPRQSSRGPAASRLLPSNLHPACSLSTPASPQ